MTEPDRTDTEIRPFRIDIPQAEKGLRQDVSCSGHGVEAVLQRRWIKMRRVVAFQKFHSQELS